MIKTDDFVDTSELANSPGMNSFSRQQKGSCLWDEEKNMNEGQQPEYLQSIN
jgi:hypothetical protein